MLFPNRAKTQLPFLEPWTKPGKLSELLREGGFERVEEVEIVTGCWWGGVGECAFVSFLFLRTFSRSQ